MAYPVKKKNKRSKRRSGKMEPAITSLIYEMPVGTSRYIDIAADLSRLNRKLYRQGYQYVVAGITVTDDVGVTSALDVQIRTAGNTWITQNSWSKGCALWHEMQQEVLADNPSVKGKWHDYKVYLTENQSTGSSGNTISALDGASGAWPAGAEWNISTYVLPQHDVDAAGSVLPAEEWVACLVGPDDVANKRFSLVKAYEESRATVQDVAPNVPAALPNSFYLKLMDDGSQDPELAEVIRDENEKPPYPNGPGEYPGGDAFTFAGALTTVARGVKNDFTPTMTLPGFTAECGLLYVSATRSAGAENCRLQIHLVPGNYRGVMALPMGQ